MGYLPYQLVQDFFHQQQVILSMEKAPEETFRDSYLHNYCWILAPFKP